MTVSELIRELKTITVVHPEVKDATIFSRDLHGAKSGNVVVRLSTKTTNAIVIEGLGRFTAGKVLI